MYLKKIFLPSLLKILRSVCAKGTQNNCAFPNNGQIKKFLLQNFNITHK